jgi:hypothetical protein
LSRDAFLFGTVEYIHLCDVVSAFGGSFPRLTDRRYVQCDEHTESGCNGCDRLDRLKP